MALYLDNQKVKLNLNGSAHKLFVTGGGGCTLPAGIYLSASPIKNPNNCRGKRFIFNGELYATTTHYAGAGYLSQLFKWDGNAWETLLTAGSKSTTGINGCTLDCVGWYGAEYNGKFHFIEGRHHWIFDGTTFTESARVPSDAPSGSSVAVCQGKLYVYSSSNYHLYEWDEANNTWIDLGAYSGMNKLYAVNGELYLTSFTEIKKISGKTLISVITHPYSMSFAYIVCNDILYAYDDDNGFSVWYKFDLENGTYTEIGKMPMFRSLVYSVNSEDISFTAYTYSGNNDRYPFFVLNIVEAVK